MKMRSLRILLRVLIGDTVACVLLVNWWIFHDRPGRMSDEASVIVVQCILAAAPFFVAARALRHRAQEQVPSRLLISVVGAFVLTVAAWIAYGYDGVAAQHSDGANIGLGWLMLASPFIAGALLFWGFRQDSQDA